MIWLLWLAACAGCLAIGHILGAGWPDLQVRYVLALEENQRLHNARAECPNCSLDDQVEAWRATNPPMGQPIGDEVLRSALGEPESFADMPDYELGDHP